MDLPRNRHYSYKHLSCPSWAFCWRRCPVHGHFMAVPVATKSFTCNKRFSKIWSALVFFAQVGRAMAVEEKSGRNMRTHSHSKRSNGKYAQSSKISQHNLWLLKGVVNKKPTIKKLPTELSCARLLPCVKKKSDRSSRAIISIKWILLRSCRLLV